MNGPTGRTGRHGPGEARRLPAVPHDAAGRGARAPITITGPPDAVLRPDPGAAQILRIHHSHVHLTGLSIDGLLAPERRFEALDAWAAIGVDISPYAPFKKATPDYLTDIVVEPHRVGGSRGS